MPTRRNGRLTQIASLPERMVKVSPFVSNDPSNVVYLTADAEETVNIAQANAALDELGQFVESRVETRMGEHVGLMESPDNVEYMDVAPMQLVSVSTALIPFLEHDDANRAPHGLQYAEAGCAPAQTGPPVDWDGHGRARGPGQRSGNSVRH